MKTLGFLFIAGFIFAFSDGADWLARNTPDWVSALILVVGLPWGAVAFFRFIIRMALEANK